MVPRSRCMRSGVALTTTRRCEGTRGPFLISRKPSPSRSSSLGSTTWLSHSFRRVTKSEYRLASRSGCEGPVHSERVLVEVKAGDSSVLDHQVQRGRGGELATVLGHRVSEGPQDQSRAR